MKKLIQLSFLSLLISFSALSQAKTIVETAYGRRADITILEDIVKLNNLEAIVQRLQKENLQIFKVPVATPESSREKKFSFLKDAPVDVYPELAEKMLDVDSGSALFCTRNEVVSSSTNIILIAEDADPMTVIHEFMHHLFETQNHEMTDIITKTQDDYSILLRKFNFKTRKVMLDNGLLISKQWRDEIKELSEEYTSAIDEGQGQIAAEEIAIEAALLKLLINNEFLFDKTRAQAGINNYSMGLTIRSESLVFNIFALNDLIITDGINFDEEATPEEMTDWLQRKAVVEKKLNDYLAGPLFKMREQIREAQELLKTVK